MDQSIGRVEDYYVSYGKNGAGSNTGLDSVLVLLFLTLLFRSSVAPDSTQEPSREEYDQMINITSTYLQGFFEERYANDPDREFIRIESITDFTLYGAEAGRPRPEFNIYINFNVSRLEFSEDSIAPTTAELFEVFREAFNGSPGENYILNFVRPFTGSQFESTNEIWFEATELPTTDTP
jgi:hypothetical protein